MRSRPTQLRAVQSARAKLSAFRSIADEHTDTQRFADVRFQCERKTTFSPSSTHHHTVEERTTWQTIFYCCAFNSDCIQPDENAYVRTFAVKSVAEIKIDFPSEKMPIRVSVCVGIVHPSERRKHGKRKTRHWFRHRRIHRKWCVGVCRRTPEHSFWKCTTFTPTR